MGIGRYVGLAVSFLTYSVFGSLETQSKHTLNSYKINSPISVQTQEKSEQFTENNNITDIFNITLVLAKDSVYDEIAPKQGTLVNKSSKIFYSSDKQFFYSKAPQLQIYKIIKASFNPKQNFLDNNTDFSAHFCYYPDQNSANCEDTDIKNKQDKTINISFDPLQCQLMFSLFYKPKVQPKEVSGQDTFEGILSKLVASDAGIKSLEIIIK